VQWYSSALDLTEEFRFSLDAVDFEGIVILHETDRGSG
jgi:hypothetical protein